MLVGNSGRTARGGQPVRRQRDGALAWSAVIGIIVAGVTTLGCGSSPSSSFVDVSVDVDPGLDIALVTMTASAPGKANFVQDFTPGSTIRTSFQPTGLADGARIRLEARGSKSLTAIVLARGDVVLRKGQHVTATLHLAADCAGVLSCKDSETCEGGRCVPVPAPDETGGPGGSGGGGSGGGGGRSDGSGGASGPGGASAGGVAGQASTGGVAGSGIGGRAGMDGAGGRESAGRAGSGGAPA